MANLALKESLKIVINAQSKNAIFLKLESGETLYSIWCNSNRYRRSHLC